MNHDPKVRIKTVAELEAQEGINCNKNGFYTKQASSYFDYDMLIYIGKEYRLSELPKEYAWESWMFICIDDDDTINPKNHNDAAVKSTHPDHIDDVVKSKQPSKGDTIWATLDCDDEFVKCTFVCEFNGQTIIVVPSTGTLTYACKISLVEPKQIVYNLTHQEALIAIGEGKKVRGELFFNTCDYISWVDGLGICFNDSSKTIEVPINQNYVIVDE